jgi:spermidine synthase
MAKNRPSEAILVYTLFFFSGMSALMYEVIWMKELTLIMGNTVQSTTAVLAAFMAGLALGSLLFGRLADKLSISPLRFYAYLELGIGVFAFAFPLLIKGFQTLYISLHHSLGWSLLTFTILRFVVSFSLLLIPTILMGATLPVLSKHVEEGYGNVGKKIGLLYAVNTFGAVIGILCTGYVLLGLSGIRVTTRIAIVVNLLVALLAFLIEMRERQKQRIETSSPFTSQPEVSPEPADDDRPASLGKIALATYFVSGFVALGYEVLWMRVFIPFLHSSTYSFSTMLAAFLTGLAVGSWIFSRFADRWKSLLNALSWTQLGIGGLTLASLFSFLFYYRLFCSNLDLLLEEMTIYSFLINFLYFFIILIPPCLLMGGVFPLVIKMISQGSTLNLGTKVGNVYFANTMGAILGSVITCFIFIPLLGVQSSLVLFVIVNVLLGLILLIFSRIQKEGLARISLGGFLVGILIILVALSGGNVFMTVLKERVTREVGENKLLYYKEGSTATVSVVELERNKERFLLVNSIFITGKLMTTKLMGHLPLLLHPHPQKALVICFGMGTTFRSLAAHGIEVQGVELVPEEIETFPLFYEDAATLLKDPRNSIEINDGRNHLLLSNEKYDVITVDPSPPLYSSGMVNLYTPEFFRLCRDRLTPKGVMSMWFFLPSCRTSEFQMLLKSFMSVFPHTTIWKSPHIYGVYAIGTKEKLMIDKENLRQRIQSRTVQEDVRGFTRRNVSFDENYLFNLFMFNSQKTWSLSKGGPNLTDDTPFIEHPLVTWWFNSKKLDVKELFGMRKDDIGEYLVSPGN